MMRPMTAHETDAAESGIVAFGSVRSDKSLGHAETAGDGAGVAILACDPNSTESPISSGMSAA